MNEPQAVFKIKRVSRYAGGVYSVFLHENEPFAVTLERESTLIPPGEYPCLKTVYFEGCYDTYEVSQVPNRTRILLHKGNWPEDSKGCFLIGESFGVLKGRTAIVDSAGGFTEFMERANGVQQFTLVVEDKTA